MLRQLQLSSKLCRRRQVRLSLRHAPPGWKHLLQQLLEVETGLGGCDITMQYVIWVTDLVRLLEHEQLRLPVHVIAAVALAFPWKIILR